MTEAQFQNLLQRYLDGECTLREQALVERWYDRLEEAESVLLRSQNQEAVEDAIWQRLSQARSQSEPVAATPVRPHPGAGWQTPVLRWAAVFVLVAAGLAWLLPLTKSGKAPGTQLAVTSVSGWTSRSNTTRQRQAFQLPDGSRVILHPNSHLRYRMDLTGSKRQVYLVGEAFFQVRKNLTRPFLVLTRQVVTTVLGTSFRVKAYQHSKVASVAVREGKVAVQPRQGANLQATPAAPASAGVLLLPNQQVVYSEAHRHLKKELVAQPAVLVPQAFAFEERPVAEVLTALEEAYGIPIKYDEQLLRGCTVSITFYEEPLFEKLGLLCKSLGAYYSISETQITLHSAGCQNQ